jgi:phosphoribosylformimino-5-aminoimidazole carboxamide ribotide isomerase
MADLKDKDVQPFHIYTAIDILEEKCVRLQQGNFDVSTTYNKDPVFVAKRWNSLGARWLHVVDLDGARSGLRSNFTIIENIMEATDLKVQVGGGIRKMDSIERYLKAGASRVVLGSIAVKEPELVKEALAKFGGDKIAIALDCRNGFVAIEGWRTSSDLKALNIVSKYKSHGLKTVIYTDIEKDGMLEGPNLDDIEKFAKLTDINIIASGGISNIEDVKSLKELKKKRTNIDGVIIGKALYTNLINPKELYTDDIYF